MSLKVELAVELARRSFRRALDELTALPEDASPEAQREALERVEQAKAHYELAQADDERDNALPYEPPRARGDKMYA